MRWWAVIQLDVRVHSRLVATLSDGGGENSAFQSGANIGRYIFSSAASKFLHNLQSFTSLFLVACLSFPHQLSHR